MVTMSALPVKNSLSEEYLTLKSPETNNELTFFNGTTLTSGVEDVLYGYDMSIRPWYAIASKTRRSTWTPAYRDMNSTNGVSISYSSPTYNKNGQFTGVVSSDLHLTELNTFLDTVKPFPNSLLLVLNNNNQIVASNDASLTTGKSQGRLVDQKGLTAAADLLILFDVRTGSGWANEYGREKQPGRISS